MAKNTVYPPNYLSPNRIFYLAKGRLLPRCKEASKQLRVESYVSRVEKRSSLESYLWKIHYLRYIIRTNIYYNEKMDKISPSARSLNMANIRSKNTKPEIMLRRFLFLIGYRYRIHYKVDKANVDIAFTRKRKAINVNGCFWHQHENCLEASKPKTNTVFWKKKLEMNKYRDTRNFDIIRKSGWKLMIVWECELEKNPSNIFSQVVKFLNNN
jgi:DNA mismatch endonuclease, patch repair protein